MSGRIPPFAARYLVAIASSAAAFALARTLQHPWVTLSPFFLFYGAVAISSWYGGTGPGLLATAIGAVAADYYLLAPRGSLWVGEPQDLPRLVLFTLVGVLIASLNGALRRAQYRCQVQADAANRSRARAQRLADANLIGVFFSDADGNVLRGNAEFLRLVGRDDPAVAGSAAMNWRDVTAPEHRDRDARALDELRQGRACTPFEKDHVLPGGRRVPVLAGYAPDGARGEVVGFVLDLTQRKRAEAEVEQHRAKLQAMASELMMAEERERRRIAEVLHDSIVQMLALSKMKIDQVRRGTSDGARARLGEVYDLIDEAIARARTLTAELSPPVLYELGLPAAVQWLGDRLRADHAIALELDAPHDWTPLPEQARVVLFQAVRELLVNIVKHAGATKCRVRMAQCEGMVTIEVQDDGRGIHRPAARLDYAAGGFGLFNIRERLQHLGGALRVESPPGGGARLTLSVPLPAGGTGRDGLCVQAGRTDDTRPGQGVDYEYSDPSGG